MRVLIGCEYSGTVRRAFAALGHDAWFCDLLPAQDRHNKHLQGDVRQFIGSAPVSDDVTLVMLKQQ